MIIVASDEETHLATPHSFVAQWFCSEIPLEDILFFEIDGQILLINS